MSFRNFLSFFPKLPDIFYNPLHKSYGQYLSDIFNYLYERSPVNFSTFTGMYHPSITRLMGNPLLGRIRYVMTGNGLFDETLKLAKLAETDRLGRAYSSYGTKTNILLTRPEDLAQLFIHNNGNIDRGEMLEVFSKIFGDTNLFTMPSGELWRHTRNQLTAWIFQDDALSNLVTPMKEIIDEFVEKMKKDDSIILSLETFMVSLTMEVFARSGLASPPLGDKTQKISDAFGKAFDQVTIPLNTMLVKLDETLKYLGIHLTKHLDQERDSLQKTLKENFFDINLENLYKHPNILSEHFAQYPNNPEAAFKDINSELGLLLLAGHETTSRLLQFALVALAQNQDVLKKLREDIDQHQPEDGKWTYEDLKKLTYLDKVIKETLRLYPPVPVIPRRVTKTFTLYDIPICKNKEEYEKAKDKRDVTKDVIIHAGTDINISPWVTHRLESAYKDPMRFNPDRFKNSSIDVNENYSWLPFGIGPRNCPGRKFSLQELELFLVKFIKKFNFELRCEGANVGDVQMRATLKHAGNLILIVTSREEDLSPKFKPFN